MRNFKFTYYLLFVTGLLVISLSVFSQDCHKYWIQFTDKKYNDYAINNPEKFLSAEAIARREKYDIPIMQSDLPVTSAYVDSLISKGCAIQNISKWFNGVIAAIDDSAKIESLLDMSFIAKVTHIYSPRDTSNKISIVPSINDSDADMTHLDYGESLRQLKIHNGDLLHQGGYLGEGMIIAVLDAGFAKANQFAGFDSIFFNKQVLAVRDFVDGDTIVYDSHYHGTSVLSVMAANQPGKLIGAAPKASYLLLRSEDAASEYLIEEYNWACAAEYADSMGADIINSSLGYVDFNDDQYDHAYDDMDGNTTISARAADLAASKGILVVASAGNKGNKEWQYIVTPADADSILTVGAVDTALKRVAFSSVGPTADGNVKPDLMALGKDIIVYNNSGELKHGTGTSYASPLIAGLAACLWEANPNASNIEIMNAIKQSAGNYNNPDSLMGYGIPDFMHAWYIIRNEQEGKQGKQSNIQISPNPFISNFYAGFYVKNCDVVDIEIITLDGRMVYNDNYPLARQSYNVVQINDLKGLTDGLYIIRMNRCGNKDSCKIIKN